VKNTFLDSKPVSKAWKTVNIDLFEQCWCLLSGNQNMTNGCFRQRVCQTRWKPPVLHKNESHSHQTTDRRAEWTKQTREKWVYRWRRWKTVFVVSNTNLAVGNDQLYLTHTSTQTLFQSVFLVPGLPPSFTSSLGSSLLALGSCRPCRPLMKVTVVWFWLLPVVVLFW